MIRNGPLVRRNSPWRGWSLFPLGDRRNRRVRPPDGTVTAPLRIAPSAETRPSRAQVRRRQLKRALPLVALFLSLGVVGTGVWAGRRWLLHSPHFAVRELRLPLLRHVSPEALRARAGVRVGDNLFSIDLGQVEREVAAEPWVRRVRARRELPSVIALDVEERAPACLVVLGHLYLAEATGEVFKRASVEETGGLPVVTGLPRDGYIDDREATQALLREAVATHRLWREGKGRPAIGEVHIDAPLGVTFYTAEGGVGIRVGRAAPATLRQRFRHFDAVWSALARSGEAPRLIFLDQGTHPERVTVRLAAR